MLSRLNNPRGSAAAMETSAAGARAQASTLRRNSSDDSAACAFSMGVNLRSPRWSLSSSEPRLRLPPTRGRVRRRSPRASEGRSRDRSPTHPRRQILFDLPHWVGLHPRNLHEKSARVLKSHRILGILQPAEEEMALSHSLNPRNRPRQHRRVRVWRPTSIRRVVIDAPRVAAQSPSDPIARCHVSGDASLRSFG
jgi:hypothetical protein